MALLERQLGGDLAYAFRSFRHHAGLATTAILSLAIGIGANTAIFSVANALLLRPLPYKNADRLVLLWNSSPGLNVQRDWFSTAQYFDVKSQVESQSRVFDQMAMAIGAQYNWTGVGEPERIAAVRMSSGLLPMLGGTPARGRLFLAEDDAPGASPVVILSHGFWARRFALDPNVIGKTLTLNSKTFVIVGAMPGTFTLPQEVLPVLYGGADQPDILVSLPSSAAAPGVRTGEDYNIIATLAPGVDAALAQSAMNTLTASLMRDHPEFYPQNSALTFVVVPLLDQVVGDVRLGLWILLASVAFVLLIACANVANLLLSRAVARQREIAIRAALGANRARIVRQLLTESLSLSATGGVLGVLFAVAGLKLIFLMSPASVPRLAEITIDGRVLAFTAAISIASGLLFGLAPAWRLARLDLQTNLKESGRSVAGGRNRLRRLLVAAEVALSFMLLVGAGLLIRSFSRLQSVSPGFNPHNVLSFDLANVSYPGGDFNHDLWPHLDALPGVTMSGGVTALPFSNLLSWGPRTVEGRIPPPGENFLIVDIRIINGRYLETMQIPLRRGRLFNEHDTKDSQRVCLVDEHTAALLWPNQDPIGKRTRGGRADSTAPWDTVVGVVGDVKQYGLDGDTHLAMYFPQSQYRGARSIVIRSTTDPATLATAVKKAIRDMGVEAPIYNIQTLDHRLETSLARRRFTMTLLGLSASLALVLAMIGTYGVMSYMVSQTEREIGIRMAIGATPRAILGFVVRQGAAVTTAGIAAGLAGALALSRVVRGLLFGVAPTDGVTFVAVTLLLAGVAFAASYIPARRAARVDPMISLRSE